MKIISMNCPNCGASINTQTESSRIFCSACGSQLSVEDAQTVGYDMEKGRIKAKIDSNKDTIRILEQIKMPLTHYDSLIKELGRAKSDLNLSLSEQQTMIANYGSAGEIAKPFGISLVVALLACWIGGIVGAIISAVAALVIVVAMGNAQNQARIQTACLVEQRTKDCIKIEEKVADTERILNDKENNKVARQIPESMRNEKSIDYMIQKLNNQTVYSLAQAVALCKEKKERENFLSTQQKMIEQQRRQLDEMKALQAANAQNGKVINVTNVTYKKPGLGGIAARAAADTAGRYAGYKAADKIFNELRKRV
ncbi:MAG: hypothetical protein IKN14_06750 [Clostridiales bacterium]|nr:hypothetical protein [Clostridiales bacterium]